MMVEGADWVGLMVEGADWVGLMVELGKLTGRCNSLRSKVCLLGTGSQERNWSCSWGWGHHMWVCTHYRTHYTPVPPRMLLGLELGL